MKRKQLILLGVVLVGVYLLVRGREFFTQWPGAGVRARPPFYAASKESFVNKTCPDGTRTDGPCLLEFPSV